MFMFKLKRHTIEQHDKETGQRICLIKNLHQDHKCIVKTNPPFLLLRICELNDIKENRYEYNKQKYYLYSVSGKSVKFIVKEGYLD